MNINDRFMQVLAQLGDLRSALLDEMLQLNDVHSMEYLLLEKEFKTIGKVIDDMTARDEEE